MVEMLIAAVVILVGLVAIAGISIHVSRANRTSNTINVLASAAQDQVDRMRTAVWNTSTEDPTLSVGGSVELSGGYEYASSTSDTSSGGSQTMSAQTSSATTSSSTTSASTSQTPERIYHYTLDPNNPHRAAVSNTPAGNLRILWQVRQGETPDLRYVTIRVVQENAPPGLDDGFTVTTIVSRN
jgi:Tfp pilus assembly protein PilV